MEEFCPTQIISQSTLPNRLQSTTWSRSPLAIAKEDENFQTRLVKVHQVFSLLSMRVLKFCMLVD
jgi:hypothetical protein